MRYALLILTFVLTACSAPQAPKESVAELLSNPTKHHEKQVTVGAYWTTGKEWSALVEPSFPHDPERAIWFAVWSNSTRDTHAVNETALATALAKANHDYPSAQYEPFGYYFILARGWFEMDPPRRYGHMGEFPAKFTVTEILELRRATPDEVRKLSL